MAQRIPVRRLAAVPDQLRVERCRRAPELGPRLVFFSGGTAIRSLARMLTSYTHNAHHLVTPFDSGGSSALLRDVFQMPSVGDMRNRLCALADDTLAGNAEIRSFFSWRFSRESGAEELHAQLQRIRDGRDPMIHSVPQPVRRLVSAHLRAFCDNMPADFDLRGASLGNLTLTGAYLLNDRDIDAVSYLYSRLLEVRGYVRCTVNAHLDIAAELDDGTFLPRQHLFSGKAEAPIASPIKSVSLRSRNDPDGPAAVVIDRNLGQAITDADLICFPMGSFYSSLIANLLPSGVGSSISRARGPRVYVPNTGTDPEQLGMSVTDCTATLIKYLSHDLPEPSRAGPLLDFVLVDTQRGHYPGGIDIEAVENLGVKVVDLDLAMDGSGSNLCPEKLAQALVSLA